MGRAANVMGEMMVFQEVVLGQHASLHAGIGGGGGFSKQEAALRGMGEAQLRGRPRAGFNSPAWLLWHMARIEDVVANLLLADGVQVLDGDDWAARLGVGRRDVGTGMDDAEVDELGARIDLGATLAYRRAVGARTQGIIAALSPDTLAGIVGAGRVGRARESGAFGPRAGWVAEAWEGRTGEFLLGYAIIGHSFLHFGELDVIRGLLGLENR